VDGLSQGVSEYLLDGTSAHETLTVDEQTNKNNV